MKILSKNKTTLMAVAAMACLNVSPNVTAGEPPVDYSTSYIESSEPISLWSVQPYALYGHTFGSKNNADGWGAGISMTTPGILAHQFEFGYDWREGSHRDLHTILAYGRFNVLEDVFSPSINTYVLAGPSYTWGFPEGEGGKNTWNFDIGAGLGYDFGNNWSLFSDYRFRWDLENKLDDTGYVRLGLQWAF